MLAAGEIAVAKGLWSEDCQARQAALIAAAGLPTEFPPLVRAAVMACLQGDKKVRAGRVRFVLPTAIGTVSIRDDVDAECIGRVLSKLSGGQRAVVSVVPAQQPQLRN